jgi:ribonuclease HI
MEETSHRKAVVIYTDGACQPNPGRGGYGIVLMYGEHRKELSGGFRLTTNNRMELYAVIKALESLKQPCKVTVYSDSSYVVNAIDKGWAQRWQANGWRRSKNSSDRAVNPDLWERMLALCEVHRVTMVWVRGHAGNVENETCDRLSTTALKEEDLPDDPGYLPG